MLLCTLKSLSFGWWEHELFLALWELWDCFWNSVFFMFFPLHGEVLPSLVSQELMGPHCTLLSFLCTAVRSDMQPCVVFPVLPNSGTVSSTQWEFWMLVSFPLFCSLETAFRLLPGAIKRLDSRCHCLSSVRDYSPVRPVGQYLKALVSCMFFWCCSSL